MSVHAAVFVAASAASALMAAGVPVAPAPAARVTLAPAAEVVVVDAQGEVRLPIGLDRNELPEPKAVLLERVVVGSREVIHVRVPSVRGGARAWEALWVAGQPSPLWAGVTGLVRGDPGERSGPVLRVLHESAGSALLLGEQREDLRLCGQEATMTSARVLDSATLAWSEVSWQQLPPAQREQAVPLDATPDDVLPALAPLVIAVGTSASTGSASALTDGDVTSVWSEHRSGAGRGEFVLFRAPADVPIERLGLRLGRGLTAPRRLFLTTGVDTFLITLPGPTAASGFMVSLPKPLQSACWALVLDDVAGRDPQPIVGLAELVAYSSFDRPKITLAEVAQAVSRDASAPAALAVLRRAGPAALEAIATAWPTLDRLSRGRVLEGLPEIDCAVAGAWLVQIAAAATEADSEVLRKAEGHLARCGRTAIPALVEAVRGPSETAKHYASAMLARVAPDIAVEALSPLAGHGTAEDRAVLRSVLARAATRAQGRTIDAALVAASPVDAEGWLDLLRALGPGHEPSARAMLQRLSRDPLMPRRYLASDALALAAAQGDASSTARLAELITRDARPEVRAHAAVLAGDLSALAPSLVLALDDREPRVREAALNALRRHPGAALKATSAMAAALGRDPWSFVRVASAHALAAARTPGAGDALSLAASDVSHLVRVAALNGLATLGDPRFAKAAHTRFSKGDEVVAVRAAAARALGAMCAHDAKAVLETWARRLTPKGDPDTVELARAARDGLESLSKPTPGRCSSRQP